MRRVAARLVIFACGISLAACIPNLPGLTSFTQPTAASVAQPSPVPLVVATATSSPTAIPSDTPTAVFTPIPTLTATVGVATALTQTIASTVLVPTTTPTFVESVSLDKLPPNIPYKRVRIENQAHEQMDISLHCTTVQGLQTVIEYNNVRNLTIDAPNGDYVYVFYVGGHRLMGGFSLLHVPSVTLTVYKDRVVIH